MSKPEYTPYLDELTKSMKLCMDDPSTIFLLVNKLFTMEIQ